jgi:hypothetical protein
MSALCLILMASALAELPMPAFPECGEPGRPDLCPDDLNDEWWLISNIPEQSLDTIRPEELALGSGVWADRAWRTTPGRWEAVIAVTDGGIEWENGDFWTKILLNTDELPLPWLDGDVQSDTYDADGNGLVNVLDWAQDSRVLWDSGNDEADHRLDTSDLIYTFSDGVDDDGNGYTDDIAGWDFFENDNDPWNTFDTNYGTHGNGVIRDAGASGNDGGNDIGVCPNCAILPIRIGDVFIVDGQRAAAGMAYAVDRGARVIAMAVGAISTPELVRQAAKYAHDNDVVIVAAAGDENAYHRNSPGLLDDILFVHSIRPPNADPDGAAETYLNFYNCNNYGHRLDLVAPNPGCATGAVAAISGIVGLVWSAAMDQGLTLSADEVRQIVIRSADDIWLSAEDSAEVRTYPSSEGWDPFYGYGRANAYRSVQQVVTGDIPPVARLSGDQWFQVIDPKGVGSVSLTLTVQASRSTVASWTLEQATGWDALDWRVIAQGDSALTDETRGFDVSGLDLAAPGEPDLLETVQERVRRANAPAVTFRLRVTDVEGRVGESRRTVYVLHDPDLLPGFPVFLNGSGESSPVLVDLDGDGTDDLVLGTASGRVLALDGAGQALPGWPVTAGLWPDLEVFGEAEAYVSGALNPQLGQGIVATVAVGDLDGDGRPEVVAGTMTGQVFVWSAEGVLQDGFPLSIDGRDVSELDKYHSYDRHIAGAPTLADVDGDGDLEIIVAAGDQRLYVWHHDGSRMDPYPIEVCHPENCGIRGYRIITSVAVGDVDADGDMDFGLGTNEVTSGGTYSVSFLYDALSGTLLPGWPIETRGLVAQADILPVFGEGHPAAMAFADIDGDGDLEIFDTVMLGQSGLLDHTGTTVLSLPYFEASGYGRYSNSHEPSMVAMVAHPAFADLDGDQLPDAVLAGAGAYGITSLALTTALEFQQMVGAWSGLTGEFLQGWPRQIEDFQFLSAPGVADLDGDGLPEVVQGSGGGILHAWNHLGVNPKGWPHFTGQWILGSPGIGDLDGDGFLEVAVTTREGWLWVWSTRGRADQDIGWAGIHHDPQNTGNHETPLHPRSGPELEGGCQSPGSRWGLILFGGLFLRRKSRPGDGPSGPRVRRPGVEF